MYHTLKYLEICPQDKRNTEQVRWVLKRARGCTDEPYYLAQECHDLTISEIILTQKVCAGMCTQKTMNLWKVIEDLISLG